MDIWCLIVRLRRWIRYIFGKEFKIKINFLTIAISWIFRHISGFIECWKLLSRNCQIIHFHSIDKTIFIDSQCHFHEYDLMMVYIRIVNFFPFSHAGKILFERFPNGFPEFAIIYTNRRLSSRFFYHEEGKRCLCASFPDALVCIGFERLKIWMDYNKISFYCTFLCILAHFYEILIQKNKYPSWTELNYVRFFFVLFCAFKRRKCCHDHFTKTNRKAYNSCVSVWKTVDQWSREPLSFNSHWNPRKCLSLWKM